MPASYGLTQAATAGRTAAGLAAGGPGAKPVAQYSLIGTDQVRFDIPEKVTGKFTYVHNLKVPGMIHGRVVRPRGQAAYPSGAPVVSVDESSIAHIKGARVVRKGDFVAVVADQEYEAIQGAAQLDVTWAGPPKQAGSGNLWKQMRDFDSAGQAPARIVLQTGSVDGAYAAAPFKVAQSTYRIHYQGHLPIGPSCAVADVRANG